MKKLALLALLLALGTFTLGCDKGKKAEPPKMDGAPAADAPAGDAAPAADAPAK